MAQHLGVLTNHHMVISDAERDMIVNALQFFYATFGPERDFSLSCLFSQWRDVAQDTHLPSVDALATKIASIPR